ncbi:MAG TPA: CBS domain-containing protein [Candidatus Competibacteraceae bacterium]|nr:CBS domain-containing protein [Candidatus Competibacteraceae bacterium]HQC73807.1 CBS domain-containing protein [Candidatus Competibacteraceae bacterium]
MTARNLMNPELVTLRPTDTVATAATHILKHHLRHLAVVDEQGRYLGTFGIYSLLQLALPKAVTMAEGLSDVSFITETAQDLATRLRERGAEQIGNWLSTDDPVAHPETPAMEVVLLMLRGHTSVPVVDKTSQRLEGMISSWNVVEKLLGEDC